MEFGDIKIKVFIYIVFELTVEIGRHSSVVVRSFTLLKKIDWPVSPATKNRNMQVNSPDHGTD